MTLRKRPKWKRIACWPVNFWKCYRIKTWLGFRDRVRNAAALATNIAKN